MGIYAGPLPSPPLQNPPLQALLYLWPGATPVHQAAMMGLGLCGRAQTSLGAIVKLCNPNMLDATTLKQVNEGLNKVLGLARSAANAKAQLEKAGLNPLGQEGAKVCLSSYLFV